MTYSQNQLVAKAPVPPAAVTTAIMTASRLGRALTLDRLLEIVRPHGGDEVTASALHLRLTLMALLLRRDPAIKRVVDSLTPENVGIIIAEFRIVPTEDGFDFDADALAATLRLATEPQGAA